MSQCDHEEADTRICVHLQDALTKGTRNFLISTVNTDVIVVLVAFTFSFTVCSLILAYL